MTEISLLKWTLAFLAAFSLGVSKAGLKGIAIVIMTIMALVFGSKASTGIVMPLLMVGDIFAIVYYRKFVLKKHLYKLLPWMLVGVLIGVVVGKELPEELFKRGMAAIIFISVILMFWWDYKKNMKVPTHKAFGFSMGLAAGFTTMIGNLAGAFTNLYFLAMRLPKNSFIGTAAWLYFIVNWFKVPFHIYSWETINLESIKISLVLIPAELIGLFLGVRIVARIKDNYYRILILTLTALGALVLFFR